MGSLGVLASAVWSPEKNIGTASQTLLTKVELPLRRRLWECKKTITKKLHVLITFVIRSFIARCPRRFRM